MDEPSSIDNWIRISVLGSGSFGSVTLWKNIVTEEFTAIKKCKFTINSNLTTKQRERWKNEVKVMKKLSHSNIVNYKQLPTSFEKVLLKYNPTDLPLLPMEYCSNGNLRAVLRQVKNSCGLSENEVRNIMVDITRGIAYLHENNITHRDIKPENIVLSPCPINFIYKLIDLGYAKEINGTISFVGSLDYIAPEIIEGKKYDKTVDYWSFGILIFEIICGVLPFLPEYKPFKRFKYIEKKHPEHICIYENFSHSIQFSTELLKETYISSCFKHEIEGLLKKILQYNPNDRNNFPCENVFNYINNILKKKIVTVFYVYNQEFYSYIIDDSTLIMTLKGWISRDVLIKQNDLILITNLICLQFGDDNFVTDIIQQDLIIYAFKKNYFLKNNEYRLPKYIKLLFDKALSNMLKDDWYKLHRKSLFFLNKENELIKSIKNSFHLLYLYGFASTEKVTRKFHIITTKLSLILEKIKIFTKQMNVSKLKIKEEIFNNLKKIIIESKMFITIYNKLRQEIEVFLKRQWLLDNYIGKINEKINDCDISPRINEAVNIIENYRSNFKNELLCLDMCKIINSALKEKDKLLNSGLFSSYAKAISKNLFDLENLIHWLPHYEHNLQSLCTMITQLNEHKIVENVPGEINNVSKNGLSKYIKNLDFKEHISKNNYSIQELSSCVNNLMNFESLKNLMVIDETI